jgi:pseudouridine-5'-phosphate glycosidase
MRPALRADVAEALAAGRPVVALESTLIAHGLPFPDNIATARAAETAVRAAGAVPATVAVVRGEPKVGLDDEDLISLATVPGVRKASRRDLAAAIALRQTAATTVSSTMLLAHRAGIGVFATGGLGGVHPGGGWDVSADLTELARTPVAVVCAGVKSLLDIPATLEHLETLGVPVIGFGCDEFPAFYLTSSSVSVPTRVDTPEQAAAVIAAHWSLGGAGLVVAQPPPEGIDPAVFAGWMMEAESRARSAGISGPAVTPFVLKQLGELSGRRTVALNGELIVANASLAGRISVALAARR